MGFAGTEKAIGACPTGGVFAIKIPFVIKIPLENPGYDRTRMA